MDLFSFFIHGRLNDPPRRRLGADREAKSPHPRAPRLLYCRIRAFEGDLVEFETVWTAANAGGTVSGWLA